MFVETVSAPREEWEHWRHLLRLTSEPPSALVASIAWDSGDGQVIEVHLWDTPEAVADFFMERVRLISEEKRERATKPRRHGAPIDVYIRA